MKYGRDHLRDYLQPSHPLFRKISPGQYEQFMELAEARERAAQNAKDAEYVKKAEAAYQKKQTIYR